MPYKSLEVRIFGRELPNFDGNFTMNSCHTKLVEIKKELNEAMIEFPKYHLKIRTEDRKL